MSALTIRRELHRANFRACSRAAEMAAATLDREHCVVMGDRETLHAVLIEHMLTDVGDLRCVAVVHTVWLWARLHQLKRPDDAAAVRACPVTPRRGAALGLRAPVVRRAAIGVAARRVGPPGVLTGACQRRREDPPWSSHRGSVDVPQRRSAPDDAGSRLMGSKR